jgi:hypothetical protein
VQFLAEACAEIVKAVLIIVCAATAEMDQGFGADLFQQGADRFPGRLIERLREFKLERASL